MQLTIFATWSSSGQGMEGILYVHASALLRFPILCLFNSYKIQLANIALHAMLLQEDWSQLFKNVEFQAVSIDGHSENLKHHIMPEVDIISEYEDWLIEVQKLFTEIWSFYIPRWKLSLIDQRIQWDGGR